MCVFPTFVELKEKYRKFMVQWNKILCKSNNFLLILDPIINLLLQNKKLHYVKKK